MNPKLTITIYSFSYHKSGIPVDSSGHNGGFVFDCRFLPNPGRQLRYQTLTGLDAQVISYLEKHKSVLDFLTHVSEIIKTAANNYIERGFEHLMVSFGCTGGQHRSVYCAEKLAESLRSLDANINIQHLQLDDLTK